jgi:hypothetical protein
MRHPITKAAIIAALLGFGVSAAFAQPQQGGGMQQMHQQQIKTDFTNDQLESFAKAAIEINEINVAYQEEAAGLQQTNPEKAQKLGEEANAQMHEAIDKQGLDVQQYQQIAMAAQADEQFRQKLIKVMQDLTR